MIVWLTSYPRSGNTFFRVLLNSIFEIKTYSIYDDRFDIGADRATSDIVGHEFLPDNFDLQTMRDDEKLYIIKTHDLPDDRIHEEDRAIYLLRDGRESTLSFWKYSTTFVNSKLDLVDFIRTGAWGNHVEEWNPSKRKNTFLIKFEDLIDAPDKFIKKIADFIEIQPSGETIPTFSELQKINPKFFKSGKKDSWKDHYSHEEHLLFWSKNYHQMIAYDYNYNIPDEFKSDSSMKSYMMEQLNKQLQDKQEIIDNKKHELHTKDNIIKEANHLLQEKEAHIQKQAKNAQILRDQIQEKETHIQKQAKNAQILREQIQEKETHIQKQAADRQRFEVKYNLLSQQIDKIRTINGVLHPLNKSKEVEYLITLKLNFEKDNFE